MVLAHLFQTMKDGSRSERRHHTGRLKNNRKMYWRVNELLSEKHLGMAVQYPKSCSCHMCGNPRKYEKQERTLDELKQIATMKESRADNVEDYAAYEFYA